jgi:CheY-like chemotaxis protein/transcriptional regulator with XRE-family HTH domain
MINWIDIMQAIRQKHGPKWRQKHIAEELGVVPSTITDLKNGRIKEPSARIVLGLARLLEVPPDEIYEALGGRLPPGPAPRAEQVAPSTPDPMEERLRGVQEERDAIRRENARLRKVLQTVLREIQTVEGEPLPALPVDPTAEGTGREERTRTRVLIVEDDEDCATILGKLLTVYGYQACTARSGAEALEWLRTGRCELVLLDGIMPDMDGLEVLRRLQADRGLREIPVIIVSAKTQAQDVVGGLRLGAADYVTKPFHIRELLARIEAVLRRRAGRTSESN